MNASTYQTQALSSTSETPAVLRAAFDSGLTVDEQLWSQESLRRRLAKVLTCAGVRVSWRLAFTDAWVSVEWREGLAFSSWACPDCEDVVETWDAAPTPESVLSRMSGHWCPPRDGGNLGNTRTNARLSVLGSEGDEELDALNDEGEFDDGEFDDAMALLQANPPVGDPSSEYADFARSLDAYKDEDVMA